MKDFQIYCLLEKDIRKEIFKDNVVKATNSIKKKTFCKIVLEN